MFYDGYFFAIHFTFSGVNICLLALQDRGNIRWIFAVLVSVVLTIWVDPYYKVYDHATSILIVAMLVLMLKIAKPREWFLAGVCLGISAIFGRNHGVYGAAAVFFVVAVLLLKSTSRQSISKAPFKEFKIEKQDIDKFLSKISFSNSVKQKTILIKHKVV